jgi:shikimate dehydrogenase
MKKFGLIGHPIAHSLSPALFKAGYDGRYPYELIETEDFEEAYRRFLDGYDGINVTAPFKELAYAKADILSQECRIIKATNLLVKTTDGIKAYNSDYLGVRMWLMEVAEGLKRTPPTSWAPPPAARGVARFSPVAPSEVCRPSVLIAGTGGAGKAAAAAALTLGLNVTLMNRSRDKAERLAEDFRKNGYRTDVEDLGSFRECFRKADIIIYNIPAAIPELEELSSNDFCPGRRKLILEANYRNPSFDEALVARIKEAGPETAYTGGRTWLLYQALTGYEIFTDEVPDLGRMSAVL